MSQGSRWSTQSLDRHLIDHAYEACDGHFKDFDDSGWDDLARFQGLEVLAAYL